MPADPPLSAASNTASIEALWYTRCPVPTASSLAIDHGWLDDEFEADGIAIASLRASAEQNVRESHFDHSQADSFRQGGNIPPIWTRSRGGDNALVAISWTDEYQAVIAMPGAGIETVADLRGRRLALPRRVNDQIDFWRAMCLRGYLSALSIEGMDAGDVDLVDLPVDETYIGAGARSKHGTLWSGGQRARRQQAEAFALIRGEVDAIYTAGAPGAQIAAFLGARDVVEIGRHPDRSLRRNNQTPTVLTVSLGLARDHPDIVARYLRLLLKAGAWAGEHRSETARIVANDVGAPEEWVHAAYGDDLYADLGLDLSEHGVAAVEAQKDFLLRHGFIEHDFDIADWIVREPLDIALGT
jgi:ABC-type nitrate/sulfonate/bicarbonate transport system substrate-binding protein